MRNELMVGVLSLAALTWGRGGFGVESPTPGTGTGAEDREKASRDGSPAGVEWNGQRLQELAEQLKDDAFSRREDAERKLSDAPLGTLPAILHLAQNADDKEAASRLLNAAKAIFRKRVASQIPEGNKGPGRMGFLWEVAADGNGLLVQEVYDDTPAHKAGLQGDDVILSFNGVRFREGTAKAQADRAFRELLDGDQVTLIVKKPDQAETAEVRFTAELAPEQGSGLQTPRPRIDEILWDRYREGRLKLPRELQGEQPAASSDNAR